MAVGLGTWLAAPATSMAASPAVIGAPFGVGDSSGNVKLNNSNGLVAIRWVARHSGVLSRLWIKTRTDTHGGAADASYYHGNTGRWRVTTYTASGKGTPDLAHPIATETFVPRDRMVADSSALGNSSGEAIALNIAGKVTAGHEFVTTVTNIDPNPLVNYASVNFLYSTNGLQGAQARNTRDAYVADGLYGLDPRELVGGARNGEWYLPGNNYGAVPKFLPVYIQQYADGFTAGQPYYSAHSLPAGNPVTEAFIADKRRTIGAIGAYLTAPDSFAAVLTVNGVARARLPLAGGTDQFVFARLAKPLSVAAGARIEVTVTPTVAGSLKSLYGDSVFARLMRLGKSYRWSYAGDPARTVPLYPIWQSAVAAAVPRSAVASERNASSGSEHRARRQLRALARRTAAKLGARARRGLPRLLSRIKLSGPPAARIRATVTRGDRGAQRGLASGRARFSAVRRHASLRLQARGAHAAKTMLMRHSRLVITCVAQDRNGHAFSFTHRLTVAAQ